MKKNTAVEVKVKPPFLLSVLVLILLFLGVAPYIDDINNGHNAGSKTISSQGEKYCVNGWAFELKDGRPEPIFVKIDWDKHPKTVPLMMQQARCEVVVFDQENPSTPDACVSEGVK